MQIDLEVSSGEAIGDVLRTSIRIAQILDLDVRFTFNTMRFWVRPTDTVDKAYERWARHWQQFCEQAKSVRAEEALNAGGC